MSATKNTRATSQSKNKMTAIDADLGVILKKVEKFIVDGDSQEPIPPEDRIKKILRGCHVPERYLEANIEQLSPGLLKAIDGFFQRKSLYIWGEVGTGKTFIVCALLRAFVEKAEQIVRDKIAENRVVYYEAPLYISIPELFMFIRDSFKPNSVLSERSIIEQYSDARRVVFDDIGVEAPTDTTIQRLYSLVDNRYRDMKQTLFTSNYNLTDLAGRIGERIPSRIFEMCHVINLKGPNRRKRA
jgi:DNA replication protein DnaC